MWQWVGNLIGAGAFKAFGDVIVQPVLSAFLKSKDVDLDKFKTAETSTEHMAVAVLDANVRFAQIQSAYVLSILQWWPFRFVLFMILLFCATRFCLILTDATLPKILNYPAWNIDPLRGTYGTAEFQYIVFFVLAKPVDTAVSGAIGLASKYLARK